MRCLIFLEAVLPHHLIVDITFWGYPPPIDPKITQTIEVWLVIPQIKQNFKGVIIAHYKIYLG